MSYRWVPLLGEFEERKDGLIFKGRWDTYPIHEQAGEENPTPERKIPSLGIALSDQEISDGTVSADVTFAAIGSTTGCELIIGFDIESRSYLSAGITGFHDAMFSIREWATSSQTPGEQPRWIPHAGGGDRRNLKPKKKYSLRVAVSGSQVELAIDGVSVASATVPANPKRRRMAGVWCMNHANVEIDRIVVEGGKPRAFIVMQFSAPYDQVYSDVVRSVCESFGLEAVRADELYGPGLIIRDVVDQIIRARVVIADITPPNPNVYFEVGYALALNKQIILLAKKGTELPFDVSAFRVLFYEDSIAGKSRVEENLSRHLRAIVGA